MLQIFEYDFMIRAFAAGSLIAAIAPLIGHFLVIKRYSVLSDTLSHVALAGIALGSWLHIAPLWSAVAASTLGAWGLEHIKKKAHILGDAALAVLLSGSLAISAAVMSLTGNFNAGFLSLLFGSIVSVRMMDIVILAIWSSAVILSMQLFYRHLFAISFDEEIAEAKGVSAQKWNLGLILIAGYTIVFSIKMFGALLIGALMILPTITAFQLARSFRASLILSSFISITATIIGIFLSFYGNIAASAAIVLTLLVFFMLSFASKKFS